MKRIALAIAMLIAVADAPAHAQTLAGPRGANGEGIGVEGTWDGAMFLELAYVRRLRTPLLGRPGGFRLSLGTTVPWRTVRATAGLIMVAARADDLALVVGGAVVGAAGAIEGGHTTSFGLSLGVQAGWMAERAYVSAFASLRPTLITLDVPDDTSSEGRGLPAARLVFGVQAGVAVVPALIVFVAGGAYHAIGRGEVGPVITAGVRVHP